MKPIYNNHTNTTVFGPEDQSGEYYSVNPLPVCRSGSIFMSYWRPSFVERLKILFGKDLRIAILAERHPPITLEVNPG